MRSALLSLLLLLAVNSPAQDFRSHVLVLASDSLSGRAPGTIFEHKAAIYIESQLQSRHISVQRQSFAVFTDSSKSHLLFPDSAINVIGFLNLDRDSTIILSAHYDHLGTGNSKSKEIGKSGIHHGADDNASGVSLMIELAKSLSADTSFKYNFLFAAYSAHELGLFGSEHFAQSKFFESIKPHAVVNFDMVGRLDRTSSTVRISGVDSNNEFRGLFASIESGPLNFRYDDQNLPYSDLKPFFLKGIPVLNFTTGVHDDYHRMSDTEDKINYSGMTQIHSFVLKFIGRMSLSRE